VESASCSLVRECAKGVVTPSPRICVFSRCEQKQALHHREFQEAEGPGNPPSPCRESRRIGRELCTREIRFYGPRLSGLQCYQQQVDLRVYHRYVGSSFTLPPLTSVLLGYGQTGPYRTAAGYDVIIEGEAGLMHMLVERQAKRPTDTNEQCC
jgi:hypothetical protein